MAFHGGSLEQGTDDMAVAAAEQAGASVYAVVQPPDLRWHVPSTEIDPAASPALAGFLDHVDVVVAVHGFGRPGLFTTILLGGGNRSLAAHVGRPRATGASRLHGRRRARRDPGELRGLHPANPVNRVRSRRVSSSSCRPVSAASARSGRTPTTAARWTFPAHRGAGRCPRRRRRPGAADRPRRPAAPTTERPDGTGGRAIASPPWTCASSPSPSRARPTTSCSPSPSGPRPAASTPSSAPTTT